VLLVCAFAVAESERAAFTARARLAAALLGAQPGCRAVTVGRGVDTPEHWVLTARFDSVTAYRRALSPFAVREHVAPLLAECLPVVPSTYEVLLEGAGGAVQETVSLRSEDG